MLSHCRCRRGRQRRCRRRRCRRRQCESIDYGAMIDDKPTCTAAKARERRRITRQKPASISRLLTYQSFNTPASRIIMPMSSPTSIVNVKRAEHENKQQQATNKQTNKQTHNVVLIDENAPGDATRFGASTMPMLRATILLTARAACAQSEL